MVDTVATLTDVGVVVEPEHVEVVAPDTPHDLAFDPGDDLGLGQVEGTLAAYRPVLLGTYNTPHGICSQPIEYLAELYNGTRGGMRLPPGDLGEHLPGRRVSFGAQTLELAAYQTLDPKAVLALGLRELGQNANKIGNLTITSEILAALFNSPASGVAVPGARKQ